MTKWKKWKHSIMEYKQTKGFTLIELIVVMAIIAVLVLLAAPRFLGRTNDAVAAQIQNDIRVAEDKVMELLISDKEAFDRWGSADLSELEQRALDEEVLGSGGVIQEFDSSDWKVIPSGFLENEMNRSSDNTFYASQEGDVLYFADGTSKTPTQPRGNVVDFENGGYSEFLGWSTFGLEDSGVTFDGLGPAAFDGNTTTSARATGSLTWSGELTGKDIEITNNAVNRVGDTSYSLEFQDDDGVVVQPVGVEDDRIHITNPTQHTLRLTVPEGATNIVFYSADDRYPGYIHDIAVLHAIETPDDIQITPVIENKTASFDWGEQKVARIDRDKTPVSSGETASSYTDNTLYTGKTYNYEIRFTEDNGDVKIARYTIKTGTDGVNFRGLSYLAFDGNDTTYARANSPVTWNGDLSGREIEITNRAVSRAGDSSYSLEFQNSDGVPIALVGSDNERMRITNINQHVLRVAVPEDATQMVFYSAAVRQNGYIYNIAVAE